MPLAKVDLMCNAILSNVFGTILCTDQTGLRPRPSPARRDRLKRAVPAGAAERLEERRLLSSSVSFSAGALTVTGDSSGPSGDTTLIETASGTLSVKDNGTPIYTVAESTVNTITVNANTLDDTITIDGTVASRITTTLNGGSGNDTIKGGLGNDAMNGGADNDTYLFTGSNNLGSDSITEAATADTDTIDFTGFGQAASINLASTSSQTV